MKVAKSWFNDFVDISDIDTKQYADALTMSGSMVEGTRNGRRAFRRCYR